jgi:cephalosporin-C deacetylase-like acetyl esterase
MNGKQELCSVRPLLDQMMETVMRFTPLFTFCATLLLPIVSEAQDDEPSRRFLGFVRRQAADLRAQDKPPAILAEWEQRRAELRAKIQEGWGQFPAVPCPLQPRVVGTLRRDGHRVEKIVLQTRPGIWMTANAYVPDRAAKEKVPAVLCVHGHWQGAKQDPVVQARCLGLTKLGFFVLVVDAFGAGERGLGKALGEYHGEMVAATLLPVGLPLCGLQVYENRRAVDYLLTRPEVDGRRIGVTGASGGGNQTMYAGAWDDRFAAVVPVCSVGNYQAYLGVACCMCEVVPGALQFTEEGGVLSLTAPRALMIVNATRDGVQFSVAEARKSVAQAQPVFALYNRSENLKHTIFESPHDYNQAMREAMYGWMTRQLKDQGDGGPVAEPSIKTEDPEELRCFPGQSRPDDFTTIPRFAAAEARRILGQRPTPADGLQWREQRAAMLQGLAKALFGGDPPAPTQKALVAVTVAGDSRTLTFQPEPGVTLTALQQPFGGSVKKLAVVLDLDGAEKAAGSELASALRREGWSVLSVDLRATGKLVWPQDRIGRAPDHNSAEWSLWLGRPLLGQWVVDVRRLLDALKEHDDRLPDHVLTAGVGPAGLVAVCAAALDPRITHVATSGMLSSFVTEEPYQGQRLGILVPGILHRVGDVAHLAALVAPRRLVVVGGVTGGGQPLDAAALDATFAFTRQAYTLEQAANDFHALPTATPLEVAESLR